MTRVCMDGADYCCKLPAWEGSAASERERGVTVVGGQGLSGQGIHGWVREALTALGFAALYFVLDAASNRFAFTDSWTIVWPLNGLTIGLLIMRPRSQWWSMIL